MVLSVARRACLTQKPRHFSDGWFRPFQGYLFMVLMVGGIGIGAGLYGLWLKKHGRLH